MVTKVYNWRFHDGITPLGRFETNALDRGWYCRVSTTDDAEFSQWMQNNCPSSYYDWKFNSGTPMWFVFIQNDEEATAFRLTWL